MRRGMDEDRDEERDGLGEGWMRRGMDEERDG